MAISAAVAVITRHVAPVPLRTKSGRVPRAHEGLSLSADARLDLRRDSLHA